MRLRIRPITLILVLISLLPLSAAVANDRIALVIGNSDYPASPLRNPVNDASDIAVRLQQLGFKVIHYENTTYLEMENAVREFGDLLDEIKGIGIFFYAGHGLQVNGRNYLMPIDADIQDETEVKHKALDVDFVLGKMELAQNSVNLLILDACRNNPFERSFRGASSRGLAPMNAPSGTVIWYATRPGKVASDGQGRNSPFTRNLLETLKQNNVEARKVISKIAVSMRNENLQQEPWQEGIWLSDFYFLKEEIKPSITKMETGVDGGSREEMHWRIIKDLNQADVFENYLDKCGKEFTCLHKQEAYKKLATITSIESKVTTEVINNNNKYSEPPKKIINKPYKVQKNKADGFLIDDIFDVDLLASSRSMKTQNKERIVSRIGGEWQCKWKDSSNKIVDKVVDLKIDDVSSKSFKGIQSMASPHCVKQWRLLGKVSKDELSYIVSPSTATSSPSCKFNKSYEGSLYELNSGAVILDLKYNSLGNLERGLMRCKKTY